MKKLLRFVFYSRHSTLTIYTIIVLTMAIRLYLSSGVIVKNSINEQMLHRQQIVSRVGASHVNDLLEDWGYDAVIFSSSVKDDLNNRRLLQEKLQYMISTYNSTAVVGGIISDSHGIVIADANRSGIIDTGNDISDRDYFNWAQNAPSGSFFYGKTVESKVGATKGSQILTITTPMVTNNKFIGLVTFAIDMREFVTKYFEPLKITGETRVYLMDRSGELIYSKYPEIVGKNYFDLFKKIESPNKDITLMTLKKDIAIGTEGKLIVDMGNLETKKSDTFLISYSPVLVNGDSKYILAISTPVRQSDLFLGPIYNNQFHALAVFVLIVLGFCIIEITIVALNTRKAYERGYRKGKE